MSVRVAVVSGGNRGLGLEIVRQLAARGLRVALGSRSLAAGQAAATSLGELPGEVVPAQLDVSDVESVGQFTRWLHGTFGRCDVLVNNAAIAVDGVQDAATADLDLARATLETNLLGAWRLTQALVPAMRARRYGRIVNVSSGVGRLDAMASGIPAYRVSKTALNALTRIFADELREDGILVNTCCPGHVRTGMGGESAGLPVADGADTPVWLATLPPDGPTGGFYRAREPLAW
jgi:NAD(P)-dependent dehydrogenase (short-subunit alcohol dehydrogenase family)